MFLDKYGLKIITIWACHFVFNECFCWNHDLSAIETLKNTKYYAANKIYRDVIKTDRFGTLASQK